MTSTSTINETLATLRPFVLRLVNHDEQAAQDLIIDLWRYDLPNYDASRQTPLNGFLRACARRHARKCLQRAKARQNRRMAVEREVGRQTIKRQLETPRRNDGPDIEDIRKAAKRIRPRSRQSRRLLALRLAYPHATLTHLGRLAGFSHTSNASRAMKRIRQQLREAASCN